MKFSFPIKKNDETGRKSEKEKVEARREEVLARGRKFKYPLQYAKHKLVFNTVIIAVVAIVALVLVGWIELYKLQDTGDIMYRISGIISVSVAKIDEKNVLFSDYLMMVRSSLKTMEQQSGLENNSEDETAMITRYKRVALTQAEDLTYALKLASSLNVEVSDEEVDKIFDERRKIGGVERSEESFLKVLENNFGLSKNEYRRLLYLSLVRAKVEQEIDTAAKTTAEEVFAKLTANGGNFEQAKDEMGDRVEYQSTGGMVDNKNVDGGRAEKASKLNPGEWSNRFVSTNGDGYYFVKLIEKTETQVNYVSIFVKFEEFNKRLTEIREQGKVVEYITVEDAKNGQEGQKEEKSEQ